VVTRGGTEILVGQARSNAWRDLYDLLIRPVRSSLPTAPGALLTIVAIDSQRHVLRVEDGKRHQDRRYVMLSQRCQQIRTEMCAGGSCRSI
jgi:hypothetical protein